MDSKLRSLAKALADHLKLIRKSLGDAPYPFEHNTEHTTLADFCLPKFVRERNVADVYQAGNTTLEALTGIYFRCLARLSLIAELSESALNLKPFDSPSAEA